MKSSSRSSPALGARRKAAAKAKTFPIVGIGASAGGLEAFTQLLKALPERPGLALVLIQHLDPKHESMTAEILARTTRMPVLEVKNGMRVASDHVYVIPSNHAMSISRGILKLVPRVEVRGPYMTIDYFFQSLAEDQANKAVGVVLSGTATDGTEGVRSIKVSGGITFAQEPSSAKFDGMPRSAILSGSIDFILSPEAIAKELMRLASHPYVAFEEARQVEQPSDAMSRLYNILRRQSRVDFSEYKQPTLHRRIARRMVVQKTETLEEYVDYLQVHPEEVDALYADILIHVTRFFRDPDAFKRLKSHALPKLMKDRPPGGPFRIWVPGCSTGEEVYSVAMTVLEFLEEGRSQERLQIFATDISEQALQTARVAVYPESIRKDVSEARLRRFFVKIDGGYKINKQIRDLCLFSKHDVGSDPPFARLDLVSCRNLLIYFSASLQKRLMPIFHYALNPYGLLWLGRSESVSGYSELFGTFDKGSKIYFRKVGRPDTRFVYPTGPARVRKEPAALPEVRQVVAGFNLEKEADRAILAESAPPGVVINERMEILQFRGRIVPFLEPAAGQASHHLLKMARPALVSDLRTLIQLAKKRNLAVIKEGIQLVDEIGRALTFDLKVIPVQNPSHGEERFFVILFERATVQEKSRSKAKQGKGGKRKENLLEKRTAQLERELFETKRYQESLSQDYEAAHQELAATNEEFQATNEELQSTNEELETAKEELQSTNEELTTVNEELQVRNTELNQLNSDLTNLLSSVKIPILMVGGDGRIRRFTPRAGEALHMIATDIGRPFSDISSNFSVIGINLDLGQLIDEVSDTASAREIETQDRFGHWFRVQVKPYRTLDNRIDGVVIAFIDIDLLKRTLNDVSIARAQAESANRAKDLFLAMLSHELRTPLTTILSWAQMLRMGRLDAEKTHRAAEMIEESGKVQAQLINDLLDVSRIVMGKLSLVLSEVDPAIAIRAAIETVRPSAEAKAIQITAQLDANAGTVMADLGRLQQVFSNLLMNSIKFSPRDSTVHVVLAKDVNHLGKIRIQVIDSGKGISAEFLPHLFDRFTQADSSHTRVYGGLGLGLAIVRDLLKLQAGSIEASSAGPGKGAVFTVYLPLKSARKTVDTLRREVESGLHLAKMGEVRLDGVRILVVDDDANAREAFTEMLHSYGADVSSVASSQEAIDSIGDIRPRVLLCDIAMPEEDGYSMIRRIRALPANKGGETPAVAVTAHAGAEDIQEALSAGYQSHVAKPVDADYLANVIASVAKHSS